MIDTSSPDRRSEDVLDDSRTQIDSDSRRTQLRSSPPFGPLPVVVQISPPHSSLDRDQYDFYIASLSQQSVQTSQIEDPDSGLGESSPAIPDTAAVVRSNFPSIIPDSQSLPGSSTYEQSTSKSSIHLSRTQIATQDLSTNISGREITSEATKARIPTIELNELIEDSLVSANCSREKSRRLNSTDQLGVEHSATDKEPELLPAGQNLLSQGIPDPLTGSFEVDTYHDPQLDEFLGPVGRVDTKPLFQPRQHQSRPSSPRTTTTTESTSEFANCQQPPNENHQSLRIRLESPSSQTQVTSDTLRQFQTELQRSTPSHGRYP